MSSSPPAAKASLETLIPELFRMIMITEILSHYDFVNLAMSSPILLRRMDLYLWNCQHARDSTLITACELGYLRLLQRAIARGASCHVARLYGHVIGGTIPLLCAMRGGKTQVFQELISRGASVDGFVKNTTKPFNPRYEVRKFVRLLSRPKNVKFLHILFQNTTATTAAAAATPCLGPELVQLCLRYTVRGDLGRGVLSRDTIMLLMAHGASMRRLQEKTAPGDCPVASAILCGYPDMAEELVVKFGLSVHGKVPHHIHVNLPLHRYIPIFAAARRMHKDGTTAVVQRLLALGAHPHSGNPFPGARPAYPYSWFLMYVSPKPPKPPMAEYPVIAYLNAIDWDYSSQRALKPFDGLRFWMDLGVRFANGRPILPGQGNTPRPMEKQMIMTLLEIHGPHRLRDEQFHLVIQALQPDFTTEEMVYFRTAATRFPAPVGVAKERWESLFKDTVDLPYWRMYP